MDEKVVSFLRKVYRGYYFKHHDVVEIPSKMASREFGYIPFGGGMIRHLSFKSAGELFAELVKQAPSSVYCSNAVYESPTLQMDEKGWKGAELIFDIDADAIPTPCKTKHTWWFCNNCHKGGMGMKPAKCPGCQGQTVEQVHWSCRECLNATKEHVKRLGGLPSGRLRDRPRGHTAVLLRQQGIPRARAGREVRDGRFLKMRAEIANYIRGSGLNLKVQDKVTSHVELGWSRRTSLFLSKATEAPSPKRNQKLTNQIIAANAALIDESVTTDIHRVFRMPGTLHGSSGLLKMRIDIAGEVRPAEGPGGPRRRDRRGANLLLA